jgi:hypothetical protein
LEVKSSSQPDESEVIAKRKGVAVRRGLKEAWSKHASHEQEPDMRPTVPGEAANDDEALTHQGRWW